MGPLLKKYWHFGMLGLAVIGYYQNSDAHGALEILAGIAVVSKILANPK